ncbi:MAG: 6-bladed beta-propeller [Chloroflexi bacterium]|uniref:6-bladed beta-propeller n=1 Tax=Candidatus Chlorohelix allophototropha TaxID=3003348 RepID=A0A8T7M881_9CHLR|nr:6-bladed beta-propeller [Chloroflexota bacterium]WJW68187.1 malectin domain-containing carbohydrate-binding protein [Chloroflexota bacterium L227-S17]
MEPPNNQNRNDEFPPRPKTNPQEFPLIHENLLAEEAKYKWQPSQNREPDLPVRPFLVPEEHITDTEPILKKPAVKKFAEPIEEPPKPVLTTHNIRRIWILVGIAVSVLIIGVVILITMLAIQTKETLVIINTTTAAATTTTPQLSGKVIAPASVVATSTVANTPTSKPTIGNTPTPAPLLKQVVAINCGGGADGSFVTDAFFTSAGVSYVVTNTIDMSNVAFPAPVSVYQSQRIGNINYIIPNLKPNSSYIIRLHFAELYINSPGMRFFDVIINQSQVLYNFDLYNAAGGMFKALVKEFPTQADANGQIYIAFRAGTAEWPVINGIEVLSNIAPTPVPATATPYPVLPTSTPILFTATPFKPATTLPPTPSPIPASNIEYVNSIGGNELNTPNSVALDKQGNIYVISAIKHQLYKFDNTGKFITAVGSQGNGDGQFEQPNGIIVDTQGNIFVADTRNHRIQKLDSNGKFLLKWGTLGTDNGQFDGPIGLALDSKNNLYVVENGNNRIQIFSSNGVYIGKLAGQGTGRFTSPSGVAVDQQGNIFITDTSNNRVQMFNSDLQFVTRWGSAGIGDNQFDKPKGIAVDEQGFIYVADSNNGRILKFNNVGKLIAQFGSKSEGKEQFGTPEGIYVDGLGQIYVADSSKNVIHKLRQK